MFGEITQRLEWFRSKDQKETSLVQTGLGKVVPGKLCNMCGFPAVSGFVICDTERGPSHDSSAHHPLPNLVPAREAQGGQRLRGGTFPPLPSLAGRAGTTSAHSCVPPFSSGITLMGWRLQCSQGTGTEGCTEGKRHPVGAHTALVQMLGLVQG